MHWTASRAAVGIAGALLATASGAAPIAPSFIVSYVEVVSGPAVGDVVAVAGSLVVGVGPQSTAGAGKLVRVDAPGLASQQETVIAEGFTAVGGMDYHAGSGRLVVADNGLEFGGPTGDNVYALASVLGTPADPPDASALAVLVDGAIPGAFDILFDPSDASGDSVFVSDASALFPPDGRLLRLSLSGASAAVLHSGLGFAAGLASNGTGLFVGDVDGLTFEGGVFTAPLATPGDPLDPLVGGLPGIYDLELSADGSLLATSGGSILRIDPVTGATSVVASGFGFASGLFEDASGLIYALDGFAAPGEANRIWVLTPVPEPAAAGLLGVGLLTLAARRRSSTRRRCSSTRLTRARRSRSG